MKFQSRPSKYVIRYDKNGRPCSIMCFVCGMTSYNENDIEHLYCAKCKVFMED